MMRLSACLALLVATTRVGFCDDPVGHLKGRIRFEGDVPKPKFVVENGTLPSGLPAKDADCFPKNIPDESLVVDPKTKGIANVFVYLRKRPDDMPDAATVVPGKPVVVSTSEGRFQPHAALVRTGQRLRFDQVDMCPHNAHVFPIKNPNVGFLLPPKGQSPGRVYSEPEFLPVQVRCDIHPWMTGSVLILDHPYAAITDSEGRFEIRNLPPGKHSFRVWHERAGYLDRKLEIEITAGKSSDVGTRSFPASEFD